MGKIFWVGSRESDITDCGDLFSGSITIYGSNDLNNVSYCSKFHKRINHNIPDIIPNEFWIDNMNRIIHKHNDAKFIFYNSLQSYSLPSELSKYIIGINPYHILKLIDNKSKFRDIVFKLGVPIVPYYHTNEVNLISECKEGYISQQNNSSGGFGTRYYPYSQKELMISDSKTGKSDFISPFIDPSVSVNQNFIITDDRIIPFPASIQIIKHVSENSITKLTYLGNDFPAFNHHWNSSRELLTANGLIISKWLHKSGYRGIIGYDFLISNDSIMFLEANGRYQASTPLINKALKQNGYMSLQEMQFVNYKDCITDEAICNLIVPYSFISYTEGTYPIDPAKIISTKQLPPGIIFYKDGYEPNQDISIGNYMFKLVFENNISAISPDGRLVTSVNLFRNSNEYEDRILSRDILSIKISLLNQGVYTENNLQDKSTNWKSAVFDSYDLHLGNQLIINTPNADKFNFMTPWHICNDGKEIILQYKDMITFPAFVEPKDLFSEHRTKNGILFSDISFCSTDRLRINHSPTCKFGSSYNVCKFCNNRKVNPFYSMDDIKEVIDYYEAFGDFRHYLIGGGSQDNEATVILEIVKYIRSKSNKPIYVMCLPVENEIMSDFFRYGVNEIAFNIEICDPEIARRFMPGKGFIEREQYFRALAEATNYWGKRGNVRSLVILGLEPTNSFLTGIHKLCEIGVSPVISIFRPLLNTEMKDAIMPDNQYIYDVYKKAESICNEFGMYLGPSCDICKNNCLALPQY
jgi:predicted ATP-grasp superfamily ATP-dependent carboligase